MPRFRLSEHDLEKIVNSINMDNFELFREYKKSQNKFIATNNFFISSHGNNSNEEKYIKIYGNNNEKYIEKKNNSYFIYYDINYKDSEIINHVKETNLIVLKNLNLETNNDLIDIKNLIKGEKISNNECDELIKDLYFNSVNFQKFNLKNREDNTNKKYLFKVKRRELNLKNQIQNYQIVI